jgi:hypothetical protein
MKKVFLILGLAISTLSFGQKKSDKFVSGTVTVSKEKGSDATYEVSPLLGYYVTDKVSVGAFGSISKDGADKSTSVGVFGRCDFLKVSKSTTVWSQVDISTSTDEVASVKTTATSVGLGLGLNHSITSKLDLTLGLGQLGSFVSSEGNTQLSLGFTGIENPFVKPTVGLLYRF